MPRKGQTFSEEAKAKLLQSKRDHTGSLYNWLIAEPYLDNPIQNGSTNRLKIHFTLREFRDHVKNNMSLADIKKLGFSKHLVQFFSNFCQGKIKLTKDEFILNYEMGKSLDEISEKYNIGRGDITFLRELYDIKRKGATFIHRKETEVPLTQRQKELVYGSLMGDAKRTSDSSVGFGHGEPQRDYLFWKYKEMESVSSKGSLKFWESEDDRKGFINSKGSWRFYTHANSDLEKIVKEFYSNGEKQVCQTILDNLTPFSIAVWYMDDGRTDMRHSQKLKTGYDITPVYHFCTDSFSEKSCQIIVKWFNEKYHIKTRYKQRGLSKKEQSQYRIIIENESVKDFISLITPHILPMFRYKIDYEAYKEECDA